MRVITYGIEYKSENLNETEGNSHIVNDY
jgi:hypothetical protein